MRRRNSYQPINNHAHGNNSFSTFGAIFLYKSHFSSPLFITFSLLRLLEKGIVGLRHRGERRCNLAPPRNIRGGRQPCTDVGEEITSLTSSLGTEPGFVLPQEGDNPPWSLTSSSVQEGKEEVELHWYWFGFNIVLMVWRRLEWILNGWVWICRSGGKCSGTQSRRSSPFSLVLNCLTFKP